MTASYVGSQTLGAALPLALQAQAGITTAGGLALAEISGKLAGLVNISAALTVAPPQLEATIAASIQTTLQLQAALNGPTVTLQVGVIAALIAELNLQLAAINAALALDLGLSTPGVHLYTAISSAQALGTEFAGVLGAGPPGTSPGDTVGAVLLAASAPTARAAIGAFCGVSI